jgi:hypothetical protein
MRSLIKFLFLLGILPLILFTSCKDNDPFTEETEYEILSKYMAQNDLDLPDVLSGWVTAGGGLTVDPVDFSVADYYIIDLRSADDFNNGHIKDANNTTLSNVLNEAENAKWKANIGCMLHRTDSSKSSWSSETDGLQC